MEGYFFKQVDNKMFSIYHAIYSDNNIFLSYDWEEYIESFIPQDTGYIIYDKGNPVGGVDIHDNCIRSPFLIPPYNNRLEFWKQVLSYLRSEIGAKEINFNYINNQDSDILISLGATVRHAQRRMLRPTCKYSINPDRNYKFTIPDNADKQEIVQLVYTAHRYGYTSAIKGAPSIESIQEAIDRRYDLFSKTNTLHFGTVVKEAETDKIVAVCIAGIYPDSPNNFATIHQVSVLPEYRKKGIAKAMIRNTINTAHAVSPAIGLGVLIGNPAELLYEQLGFTKGPNYADMTLQLW
ncbi:MAG: GCN5-related N-acetyltransferase [Herbinix sp.]|jgi:ribosomal protein S18 acetylase RimI-like enzyme|nr:GCN5-related N-acetyltransferase [Herbinix sp.]